jgi:hypothetical protein
MAKLYNLARMTTATTGTGTITLGSAASGFLTFAQAGVSDGETVWYAISDGANREDGYGVYTASGTTLTRTVLKSTNSNNAISLSGTAQVFITPAAESFGSFTGHGDSTYTILPTDRCVGTNAAFTGSRTWTLPAASKYPAGIPLVVADFQGTLTATNTLVVARAGSDTIDGATSITLDAAYGFLRLVSDGSSKWKLTGASGIAIIESNVASGSAVSLSSGVAANITNISLPPGDWDVWGTMGVVASVATTAITGSISTTSATNSTPPGSGAFTRIPGSSTTDPVVPVGMTRLSLSTTTTVYLVTSVSFASGTCSAYGYLGARRRAQ